VNFVRILGLREVASMTARIALEFALDYAFSVSLLLTPLCCDDIHDVTPRVSALAGCDTTVSCYTDVGYLTDADDLNSHIGYVFVLNGGAVDWKSAKQSIFATSSIEAEYIAAFDAFKEAQSLLLQYCDNMYCDNTGITKGARHFRAKVYYLREVIEFGDIKLEKVHTYDNLADPFMKALDFPKHSKLTRNIGMLPASSLM
ncbi:hypothetical protein Tco_0061779, partial [Tanacetum coccineum]